MSKNVTAVGFHEEGKWMFTGGEDSSARIWDLRYVWISCKKRKKSIHDKNFFFDWSNEILFFYCIIPTSKLIDSRHCFSF